MKSRLEDIPELPAENHPFFLLPEHRLRPLGTDIAYREAGGGPPILLLHGLWTSALTFRSLLDPLSASHRVILPELVDPADGRWPGEVDVGPERLAELVLGICRSLELDRPVVVGHGESGLAALWLALEHPEIMRTLVTVGMPIELTWRWRLKSNFLWRSRVPEIWAQKGFSRPQLTALSMLDYADPTVVSRQEIRQLAHRWSVLPGARTTAQILLQTLSPSYYQPVMKRLSEHVAAGNRFPIPIKMVYGDADSRATRHQGEKLNRLLLGSELLVAKNSGGAVQVEKPEWTAQVILSAATR